MNMILHDNPRRLIKQGNTLCQSQVQRRRHAQDLRLRRRQSALLDKRWSTGLDPLNDAHERFQHYGAARQAGRLRLSAAHHPLAQEHRQRRLHSAARRALPRQCRGRHSQNLVRKGYIKGIIGLPANLFYGTGIPACIVVIDKENAHARKGIFMIDASQGFIKDGPKNRLRDWTSTRSSTCSTGGSKS
jgi:type I restriction enzyme M protein